MRCPAAGELVVGPALTGAAEVQALLEGQRPHYVVAPVVDQHPLPRVPVQPEELARPRDLRKSNPTFQLRTRPAGSGVEKLLQNKPSGSVESAEEAQPRLHAHEAAQRILCSVCKTSLHRPSFSPCLGR